MCPVTSNDSTRTCRWAWRVFAGVLLLAALVFVVGLWSGCRQYPPVTSREALNLVRQLNTACNTKDLQRLAEVERRLAELDRQGKLSAAEKTGFEKVIGQAKAGKWEEAETAAFKVAQDQVGVGHPAPDDHPKPTRTTGRKR